MNQERIQWLDRYKKVKSNNQAQILLNSFDNYLSHFSINEDEFIKKLQNAPGKSKYNYLDDIVQFWAKDKAPATVRNYFIFLRSYLRRYNIETSDEDVKDYVKFQKIIKERREALTKEIITHLLEVSNKKYQALLLLLMVSGMRINEALNCKISWLDTRYLANHDLVLINIPAIYTKTQVDRFTFITRPVYEKIKPYTENQINDNKIFQISYDSAKEYMRIIRKRIDYTLKYNTGFSKITLHTFRSYTRTILSDNCGMEFAYFILGEDYYLPVYYRKTPEQAAQLYKKALPDLTL